MNRYDIAATARGVVTGAAGLSPFLALGWLVSWPLAGAVLVAACAATWWWVVRRMPLGRPW